MKAQKTLEKDIWDDRTVTQLVELFQSLFLFYLKSGVIFNPALVETSGLFKFLNKEDQKALFEWYWVISHQNLIWFIPDYFRKMTIKSELTLKETRGRPDGVPHIPLTLKRQLSSGMLRTHWISMKTLSQYDTIESRLVKTYNQIILNILQRLKTKSWIYSDKKWLNFVRSLENKVTLFSKNSILQVLRPIEYYEFEEEIQFRIRKMRISFFSRMVLKSLIRYWEGKNLLVENVLKVYQYPSVEYRNRLFELCVFFDEVKAYLRNGWIPRPHNIFLTKSHPMIILEKGDYNVEIYFQTSRFTSLAIKNVFRDFELGTTNIFDIISLEINRKNDILENVKIVEVKRSNNPATLKSGLEQLLFYCNIFESEKASKNTRIIGKLVSWDYDGPSGVKTTLWKNYRLDFESFFKNHEEELA